MNINNEQHNLLIFSNKTLLYKFNNFNLLRKALTHSSFDYNNNECLEFLGDSILNFIITNIL